MNEWNQSHDEWEYVLNTFGFVPREVEQRGGVYKVCCKNGIYALKPTNAPYEKLMILSKWFDQARQRGFLHLLPWVHAQNGETVVKTKSNCWYATPWKEQEQPENTKKSPVHWVHALASFHQKMEPLVESWPELKPSTRLTTLNHWKEQKNFLDETFEHWSKQEYPSPFAKRFLSLKDPMDQLLSFAIRGMERLQEKEEEVVPRYTLCHLRIHPRNVVQDEDNFYFIDFDHAQVDTPVRDLALMIRRFGTLSSEEGPEVLLETYESQNPLKPKEKKLLAIYLSYPERLLKTIWQYQEQARIAEEESVAVQRLEKEWNDYHQLQDLTKKLWKSERSHTENREVAQVRAERSGKKRKKSRSNKS